MKILVILSRIPYPLEKGDKLRAFNHIKYLAKNNEIVLCALNDEPIHPDTGTKLKPYCSATHFFNISKTSKIINLLRAFFKGIPFQAGYFYNRRVKQKINAIIDNEKPDHIFCQLIRVAPYVMDSTVTKTLDYQDVFSKGIERRIEKAPRYLRPLFKSEYRRLLRFEKLVFDRFDNKVIISKPDRDLIPHPDKDKIQIIPNGVDMDFFHPMDRKKDYDLVFIGNMGYPPNVDAAGYLVNEILPHVHKSKPDVRVLLAGATPDKRVLALQSENVQVTGWVDDIRDCYARAKIFIAPMQIGTGLQNKLLEAMAMKIPSVTSGLANSALGAKHQEEILVAEKPAEYAQLILNLLDNPEFSNKLAEAGHQFVQQNYCWDSATAKMEKLMVESVLAFKKLL
nr:glycosyltransferase [Bacteroidota bacterium]